MKRAPLLLACLVIFASVSHADVLQRYSLAWSGAALGNSATASGVLILDLTTLPNPSQDNQDVDIYNDIVSISVSVTGASSGNGTWTKADLFLTYWWTGNVKLNMLTELIGQPTVASPWGTPDGNSGDFNLFFNNSGPEGTDYFTLTSDGISGDPMLLTQFSPVVPEPGSLALLGGGLLGVVPALRWKARRGGPRI